MADTETYTVTKRAGPRVAGKPAKANDELQLTEAQARAELLAGAIVKGGKGDRDPKAKDVPDPFRGSDDLEHIRARARGLDEAPAPPAEEAPADRKASGGGKPPAESGKLPVIVPPAGGQGAADGAAGA